MAAEVSETLQYRGFMRGTRYSIHK